MKKIAYLQMHNLDLGKTLAPLFALHTLILYFMNMNARLSCAFVDLKKAVDSVYRNALWYKLFNI